jgi:methionyl-tRNA synthetase
VTSASPSPPPGPPSGPPPGPPPAPVPPATPAAPAAPPAVTFDEFKKLRLVVAEIKSAALHPNADRLLVLQVDVGDGRLRQIVAGIRAFYAPETLVGRKAVVVENLQPAKLRGVESQGMLLAAVIGKAEQVRLVALDDPAALPPGTPVS